MPTVATRLTLAVVSLIVIAISPNGLSGWQPVPFLPQDLKEEDKIENDIRGQPMS